ncbi:MAG: transposase [Thermoleophilaceae bacterium]|nr:transposase [Thermoleophilaceae bacterium]
MLDRLHRENPDFGRDLAIDASDLPACANGQRYLSKNGPQRERFSDPDASWGHRSAVSTRKGGGFYGYKVHAAVCARTDLPVAWQVETAGSHESNYAAPLLDTVKGRGFAAETTTPDMGYDNERVYGECEDRDSRPIIPLRDTPGVKRGDHRPPECDHGTSTFAGSDPSRGASKWCCPTSVCEPERRWVKADRLHPLIPRESKRWKSLYRGRASVEREFGRLKNEWAPLRLRVRGIERVRLHSDLTILAKLASKLGKLRADAQAARFPVATCPSAARGQSPFGAAWSPSG